MTFELTYEGGKGLGPVRGIGQSPAEEAARSDSLGLNQA